MKELLKSVHICQSYRKNKSGTFFVAHGVVLQVNLLARTQTENALAEKLQ